MRKKGEVHGRSSKVVCQILRHFWDLSNVKTLWIVCKNLSKLEVFFHIINETMSRPLTKNFLSCKWSDGCRSFLLTKIMLFTSAIINYFSYEHKWVDLEVLRKRMRSLILLFLICLREKKIFFHPPIIYRERRKTI